jgi:hypothetical protein
MMDDVTRKEIAVLVYLFLPLAISGTVFVSSKGFRWKISSGLSIIFDIVAWFYIEKSTSGNPGYMIPVLHMMYPIACLIVFVVLLAFELVLGYILNKKKRITNGQPRGEI